MSISTRPALITVFWIEAFAIVMALSPSVAKHPCLALFRGRDRRQEIFEVRLRVERESHLDRLLGARPAENALRQSEEFPHQTRIVGRIRHAARGNGDAGVVNLSGPRYGLHDGANV